MTRRVPFPFIQKPGIPTNPQFGEPVLQIKLEIDANGLLKTTVNKQIPAVQLLGILLDCMQGQYQVMAQQASMLINPKGEPVHGGQEKENHDGGGRDPGESNGIG